MLTMEISQILNLPGESTLLLLLYQPWGTILQGLACSDTLATGLLKSGYFRRNIMFPPLSFSEHCFDVVTLGRALHSQMLLDSGENE